MTINSIIEFRLWFGGGGSKKKRVCFSLDL